MAVAESEHETDSELVRTDFLPDQLESSAALMALHAAEIDTQIATAKKYPRSIKVFRNEALQMVTLTEEIAGECIYSLPRSGKAIEGPSARFGEIILSAWGNSRAGARIVSEDDRFVTAQGVFSDLQRNVAITYEVRRRITDKNNNKYKDDMIGVTSNAACSIALRNAILKGIPKAFWKDIYDEARKAAIGDAKTLSTKRASMLDAFGKMGVVPEKIFTLLEIGGIEDITLDHLATLRGTFTAIKEGDTTIEQVFEPQGASGSKAGRSPLNEQIENGEPPRNPPVQRKPKPKTAATPPTEPPWFAGLFSSIAAADEIRVQEILAKHCGAQSTLAQPLQDRVHEACARRLEALGAAAAAAPPRDYLAELTAAPTVPDMQAVIAAMAADPAVTEDVKSAVNQQWQLDRWKKPAQKAK